MREDLPLPFEAGSRVRYVGPKGSNEDVDPGDVGTVIGWGEPMSGLLVDWDRHGGEIWDAESWEHLELLDGD